MFLRSCSSQFYNVSVIQKREKKQIFTVLELYTVDLYHINALPFTESHLLAGVHDGLAAAWCRRSDLDREKEALVLLVLLQPGFAL